jgi:arylsulfatase
MHVNTHLKPESVGKTGKGLYPDGMVEHDGHVGQLLKKLDDLGIANDTIVVYTTDNGAEVMSWPDGGSTPFRGEKATNWEGAFRVPNVIRWPGTVKPGHGLQRHLRARGFPPDVRGSRRRQGRGRPLHEGLPVGKETFKVHLDGYDLSPFFRGEAKESPRSEFLYWNDDGELVGCATTTGSSRSRFRSTRDFEVWEREFTNLACPTRTTCAPIRSSAGDESFEYDEWKADRAFMPRPGAGDRRAVAPELQGVPDPPEARELQPRRGDAEDDAEVLVGAAVPPPRGRRGGGSARRVDGVPRR